MEAGFFLKRQWADLSVFEYVAPYEYEFELDLLVNEATNLFNAWGISLLSVEWRTVLEPWVNYDNTYLVITLSLTPRQIVDLPREDVAVKMLYEKFMNIITPATRTFERRVNSREKTWYVSVNQVLATGMF